MFVAKLDVEHEIRPEEGGLQARSNLHRPPASDDEVGPQRRGHGRPRDALLRFTLLALATPRLALTDAAALDAAYETCRTLASARRGVRGVHRQAQAQDQPAHIPKGTGLHSGTRTLASYAQWSDLAGTHLPRFLRGAGLRKSARLRAAPGALFTAAAASPIGTT